MKRGIFLAIVFVIIFINPISSFNFQNTTSTQNQDFNFGGSTTINTFSGNLTNFSQMADSNTGNIAPNNGEGITWSSSIMKWVATVLDESLIWGRNTGTNTIFPLNDSNLDMSDGGGNVTASTGFFDFLGSLANKIQNLWVDDVFVSNNLNVQGSVNISKNLSVTDIYSTNINNSGDVFIGERLFVGGLPSNLGLFAGGGVSVGGSVIINSSSTIFASPNGVSFASVQASTFADPDIRFTFANFDEDTSTFCDPTNPFISNDKFKIITILNLSASNPQRTTGEIINFINSSCVIWLPQVRPEFSQNSESNIFYVLSSAPIQIIYDNSAAVFTHEGDNAKHAINFKNNSEEMLVVNSIGEVSDQTLGLFTSDINGQNGFTNIRSFIESSNGVNDTTTHNLIVETDLTNFNGGEYHALEIDILNPNDTETTAIVIDSEFDNLVLVTKQEDASKIWLNDSGSLTNITNDVLDSGISTSIFSNNGSTLYIGNIINFTKVSFGLDVNANENLELIGFFCNESGWFDLDIMDRTNGMQGTGSISFQNPEDRGECNFQIDESIFSGGENFTYVAFQRTNPSIAITPNATLIELVIDSSLIKIGNLEGVTGAPSAFGFFLKELLGLGEPIFYAAFRDSLADTRISFWNVARQNNSGSGVANSFMAMPDNDLQGDNRTNMTQIANVVQRFANYGIQSVFDYDSSQNRTGIASLYSFEGQKLRLHNDLGQGSIFVEGSADFVLGGNDADFFNGSIHPQTPVAFTSGFEPGDSFTSLSAIFPGTLSPFSNDQSDIGNWIVLSSGLCDDGLCAKSTDAGSGIVSMSSPLSTLNVNQTSVHFVYSLVALIGGGLFNVNISNATASEIIFSDATDDVSLSSQLINLNEVWSNQSNLNLRFKCDFAATVHPNRECYVDTVKVNGTFTANTTAIVNSFDSEYCGADGSRDINGNCNVGIRWDAETAQWIFAGTINATGTIVGGISGSGTTNTGVKFVGTTAIGNANWFDDGVSINMSIPLNVDGDFNVNNSNLFVDISSGNVGIGTSSPSVELDVNGSINIPTTTNLSKGIIFQNGNRFLHTYGSANLYLGNNVGNFVLTGNSNLGVGFNTLALTTSGSSNVGIGISSLSSITSGSGNVAIGSAALLALKTSSQNVALGWLAGQSVTGSSNMLIGGSAGRFLTSGSFNVYIGQNAGAALVGVPATGSANIGIGRGSMISVTSAADNVGIGFAAMRDITEGTMNTAIGNVAGMNITTGDNNVLIGADIGATLTTEDGVVWIGHEVGKTNNYGANTLAIDNSDTATPLIYGEFDNDLITINGDLNVVGFINVTQFGAATGTDVCQDGGVLSACSSSRVWKENINNLTISTNLWNKYLQLNPVTFNYINKSKSKIGLIAEEVIELFPRFVYNTSLPIYTYTNLTREAEYYNETDGTYHNVTEEYIYKNHSSNYITPSIDYDDIAAANIKFIQDLKTENEMMKEDLCSLGVSRWC